jgi:RimJ/RimL family protein N-acetyltransferase
MLLMRIELECLEPEVAESIAKGLLAKEPGSKFFQIFDRNGLRDESCVLIKSSDEYIGFAAITSEGRICEIYRFFIVPDFRGEGLGTLAARELESLLKGENYRRCYLQIDDERTFKFWIGALGALQVGNESANMYYKEY